MSLPNFSPKQSLLLTEGEMTLPERGSKKFDEERAEKKISVSFRFTSIFPRSIVLRNVGFLLWDA